MDDRVWGIPPDFKRENDTIALAAAPEVWHIPLSVFRPIWDAGITGKGVTISGHDTGVDETHPYLPSAKARRSFVGGDTGDRNGHGTHTMGTALGREGIGVAPEADLLVAKVLSDSGSGGTGGINASYLWAAKEGADVLNFSLGGSGSSQEDIEAINRAYENGASVVVASAGNASGGAIGYPGGYLNTWCQGAHDRNDQPATFQSSGRAMDATTAGVQIVSCRTGGGLTTNSGTSMSAPFMSGLFGLMIHKMRRLFTPVPIGAQAWREWMTVEGFFQDLAPGTARDGFGKPLITNILTWLGDKDPQWL